MNYITIYGPYITLGQLLKREGFVANGGELKHFLDNTLVLVNQEAEKRRGRKLYVGDYVKIADQELQLKHEN